MVWDVIPDGSIESAGFRGHFTLKWGEHSSSPFCNHTTILIDVEINHK